MEEQDEKPRTASSDQFDALVWAAANAADDDSTLVSLMSSFGEKAPSLNITTVLAPAGDPLAHIARHANLPTEIRSTSRLGALSYTDGSEHLVISSWSTEHQGVYHLVTTAPASGNPWKRFERWIAAAAPDVSTFFLNREEFEDAVKVLSHIGSVALNRLTWYSRTDSTSTHRGFPERPPALDAFQAVMETEEGVQLRTAHLRITAPDQPDLTLFLRRAAGASYYNGDFETFYKTTLRFLADSGATRLSLLRGRERHAGQTPPEPVYIRLDDDYFTDRDHTGRLVSALTKYAHSDVAVLHRNPYLHVVVTDYTDGSNFDIFVTEGDGISVFGGYRASVGATARLTEFLSERFAADEILGTAEHPQATLEELFATG